MASVERVVKLNTQEKQEKEENILTEHSSGGSPVMTFPHGAQSQELELESMRLERVRLEEKRDRKSEEKERLREEAQKLRFDQQLRREFAAIGIEFHTNDAETRVLLERTLGA